MMVDEQISRIRAHVASGQGPLTADIIAGPRLYKYAGGPLCGVVIVLLFGINAAWSLAEESEAANWGAVRYSFFADVPDLLDYLFVVPLWVCCGFRFGLFSRNLLAYLAATRIIGQDRLQAIRRFHTSLIWVRRLLILAAFPIAVLSTGNYLSDLAQTVPMWWTYKMTNGARVLTEHGKYYAITNFLLAVLVIVFLADIILTSLLTWRIFYGEQDAARPQWNHYDGLWGMWPYERGVLINFFGVILGLGANIITWQMNLGTYANVRLSAILLLVVASIATVSLLLPVHIVLQRARQRALYEFKINDPKDANVAMIFEIRSQIEALPVWPVSTTAITLFYVVTFIVGSVTAAMELDYISGLFVP